MSKTPSFTQIVSKYGFKLGFAGEYVKTDGDLRYVLYRSKSTGQCFITVFCEGFSTRKALTFAEGDLESAIAQSKKRAAKLLREVRASFYC